MLLSWATDSCGASGAQGWACTGARRTGARSVRPTQRHRAAPEATRLLPACARRALPSCTVVTCLSSTAQTFAGRQSRSPSAGSGAGLRVSCSACMTQRSNHPSWLPIMQLASMCLVVPAVLMPTTLMALKAPHDSATGRRNGEPARQQHACACTRAERVGEVSPHGQNKRAHAARRRLTAAYSGSKHHGGSPT